jgi:hypothetical protein
MSTPAQQQYHRALEAACALAGFDGRDAALLHVRGNAVYHLPRPGVIARLRLIPADPDPVRKQITAAVQAAAWLGRHGFPAAQPLDLDQPIAVDGHLATFWRYETVNETGARDLTTLGKLIRRLHSLPQPDVLLPPANPLGSMRSDLGNSDAITAADRRWLLARADDLEEQYDHTEWTLGTGLIHGDAHADNLLHTPRGVVLGDWDSVSNGPWELDLIPTSMWYRYGRPRAEWDTFCVAYDVNPDDVPGLPLLQKLRELHALAAYARNANDDSYRTELTRRIMSLASGDSALPWRAL